MASVCVVLSEQQFMCSICLDVFTDPVTAPCGHNYCRTCITRYWDTDDLCRCPLCQTIFNNRPNVFVNTLISEMVHQFRSHKLKEEYEAKTEAEVQQMIRERQVKIQDVKHSVELNKKDADRQRADSVQVFTALISCIQIIQAEFIDVIEEKQKTTEKQAEGFIKELQQEITQLEKRSSELKQLSDTEDHLHLLQNFTSINPPPPTKDWSKVNVHPSSYVGTVRTAVDQLEKTLSQEMKKLWCVDLRRIQQYAMDVTLDPDTANPYLILSEDGKQVSHGNVKKNLPNNTKRFSAGEFIFVLGKQSFSSGGFYYEVQVKGKTGWVIGVVRESINRKEYIEHCNGFWTIWFENGKVYKGGDPAVLLPAREEVQNIGVFVAYEEGRVSFYDVEARDHIYSFTGCTFAEKLCPFFCPGFNNGGKNSAPLIIRG